LRGVWNCMKAELRQMMAQGSGAIVNCSSIGGMRGSHARLSPRLCRQGHPHQRSVPRDHWEYAHGRAGHEEQRSRHHQSLRGSRTDRTPR
jgi:NAD(P)-dependent dehydrogenase (short-subunit alcohol dehydrogenase family)